MFSHTGVFGRVMEPQSFRDAPSLSSRKGLVQGSHAVGVQIVKNHPYHWSVGIGYIHQPLHLVGEVLQGTAFSDGMWRQPARGSQAGRWRVPPRRYS